MSQPANTPAAPRLPCQGPAVALLPCRAAVAPQDPQLRGRGHPAAPEAGRLAVAGPLELSITSPSPAQLGEAPLDQAPASILEPEVPAKATTEAGAPAREFAILVPLANSHSIQATIAAGYRPTGGDAPRQSR